MRTKRSLSLAATVVPIVLLALLPLIGAPQSWLLYSFLFFVYLAMANMWNLLAGYSGLISLCQPAFLGLAGYTLAIGTWVGIPWWAGLLCGALVAALFALLISIPVFRLSGIYFAIGTLVVPEALRMIFYLWRPVGGQMQGGGAGYMIKGTGGVSTNLIYWLAFVIGIGSIFLIRRVLRSRLGLGLAAIRDNERTAASCGVSVFKLKLYTFVIAAFVTGLAGAVYYLYQGYIEPSATFNVKWTMTLLLATVIGGIRTEEGPLVGTIVVVFLYFLLARYAGYSLLIQGIILIGIMLASPQGIVGMLRRSRYYRYLTQFVGA
ncbi:MAG TPA: branched-chain amino acid ABC transporter permease [Syntrophorhabdales bacterium]|nr:branched-chain amino acid ABC transporter permease [Syntrophorhabdales bacterium]